MTRRSRVSSPGPEKRRESYEGLPAFDDESENPEPQEEVVRNQSRPKGEFMGNPGCFFWTFFIPTAIYYFYGIMVMHGGRLVNPLDATFWYDLIYNLPDGLSIRPCLGPAVVSLTWVFLQMAGEIWLPVRCIREGVMLKNGRRLLYPMNGMLCFALSNIGVVLVCYFGILKPYYVFLNMGALLTEGVITSFAMALWLYIDFGLCWRRHVNDEEFEEDHGVFDIKDFWNDFFMGVVRNPRLFKGTLKIPFDLKRFWNARPGLTGWVLLNISYMAAMYYNCRLPSAYTAKDSLIFSTHAAKSDAIKNIFANVDPNGFCDATGSFDNIGWTAIFISLAHWYYIFDYNLVEPAYLTTTDIRHDLFGFMLTYGDWGFLSRFYPITFMGFLSVQGSNPAGYITKNYMYMLIGFAMHVFGMLMFRITNIEKHLFRTHMNDGGDPDKYRSPLSTRIFFGDKKVQFIRTSEGSLLLTSGFWGLARHFNYIGDLTMCVGWAIACYNPTSPFPWLPISYCVYFWIMDIHRCFRDEERCAIKYGEDWKLYKETVPYAIFPGIF
eukprot:TRINITY_DN3173_c0_g1_i1.p1 TRINITY_DN3173_c0_g1~~TRINITY_DN3173_c0_g1_i1.p1  ORF type:complete len:580 (-),score=134.69 TRINITY_DN3173_c0_g1_i1:72-1724(-)